MNKKVVLAYSGGLDTSVAIHMVKRRRVRSRCSMFRCW